LTIKNEVSESAVKNMTMLFGPIPKVKPKPKVIRTLRMYSYTLGTNKTLAEKISIAVNYFLNNNKETNKRIFYATLDLPESHTTIILDAIYLDGVTIGIHKPTNNVFVRNKNECWFLVEAK